MYYLEANHIVKQYASHRALDNVTVHVPENGIYGLLGPNGAGKTTLIRIINQITAPDEGEVLIKGRPLHPSDVEHIGYLPEERGLYKKMKVGEQILYLAQLKGLSKNAAKEGMKYWLNKFDIKGWEKKKIEELSKGMQQKIQFITTVMHNPKLLIFDEPTAGLDAKERIRFRNVISSLAADKIVILATHIVTDIAYVAKTVVLMNGGKIIKTGTQEELCSDISGKVWEITAESDKVMEYMSRMRVSNAVSDGSKYTLRIVSDNLPEQGAKTVQPTLEDVCIYYFGDM